MFSFHNVRKYKTHFNGDKPFTVVLDGRRATITDNYSGEVRKFKYLHAFVPQEDDEGNTILLHLKEFKYLFIGGQIYEFESVTPIVEYHSPISNNDVPSPYARDKEGYYYILNHRAGFKWYKNRPLHDPYDKYEDISEGCDWKGYREIYIDDETSYPLIWNPRPRKMLERIAPNRDVFILIRDDGSLEDVDREFIVDLMKQYGREHNLFPLKIRLIKDRRRGV